jgi:hypothetical protein
MNIRLFAIGSVAFSSFFFTFLVGCAAEPLDEETAPSVETSEVETKATGTTCDCPSGQELQAGLCYPTCASGYHGVGPVCWETGCASGFTDDGAFCRRDSSIVSANNHSCPWYDKCGLTVKKGCSTCPSGYTNDGCTCRRDAYIYAKRSYGRGAGTTATCTQH